jgi:hypothetical protein
MIMNTLILAARVLLQAITAVAVAGWQMVPPAFLTMIAGLAIAQAYITAQLPVKRLLSNSKSPIIGQIQNALVGLGLLSIIGPKWHVMMGLCLHSFCSGISCPECLPKGASSEIRYVHNHCTNFLGLEQVRDM